MTSRPMVRYGGGVNWSVSILRPSGIAELIRAEPRMLSILGEHGLPEGFDGLRNGRLIACLSSDLRAKTRNDRAGALAPAMPDDGE